MATKKPEENNTNAPAPEATALPVVETAAAAPAAPAFEYEVVKHVTRELLKPDFDTPVFIKIESEMIHAVEDEKSRKGKNSDMAPPILMDVIELQTGAVSVMIVPAVLESELKDNYPENSYVNKCFRVQKIKLEGKKYSGWKIQEIAVKTA